LHSLPRSTRLISPTVGATGWGPSSMDSSKGSTLLPTPWGTAPPPRGLHLTLLGSSSSSTTTMDSTPRATVVVLGGVAAAAAAGALA
jgi:hypothetical protein